MKFVVNLDTFFYWTLSYESQRKNFWVMHDALGLIMVEQQSLMFAGMYFDFPLEARLLSNWKLLLITIIFMHFQVTNKFHVTYEKTLKDFAHHY